MTRPERNDYNYLRKTFRNSTPGYGANLTIETGRGAEYKRALHELYTSLGFHPCTVTTNWEFRVPEDNTERLVYIKEIEGIDWRELYSKAEKELFESKLN